jgi:hypothetical protein
VRYNQRQRVLVPRTDIYEVDVQPVDFSDEVRHGVEPWLDLAPVVVRLPVAQNLLDRFERHALRVVANGSCSGKRVSAKRRRRSARAAAGTFT